MKIRKKLLSLLGAAAMAVTVMAVAGGAQEVKAASNTYVVNSSVADVTGNVGDGIFLADGYLDGNQLVWIPYLGGLPGGADLCDSGCCGILYLECYVSDDPVKADRRKTGTDSDQTWDFLIKEWGRT